MMEHVYGLYKDLGCLIWFGCSLMVKALVILLQISQAIFCNFWQQITTSRQ